METLKLHHLEKYRRCHFQFKLNYQVEEAGEIRTVRYPPITNSWSGKIMMSPLDSTQFSQLWSRKPASFP